MSEEQLFDWPVEERKPRQRKEVVMVPRPPGYHAISTRNGVVGFHRTKITAEMARNGSVLTYCGIVGRRVPGIFPKEVPLCEECEQEFRSE